MRHITPRTKRLPLLAGVVDPCAGLTGLELYKCRKRYPEINGTV